VDENGELTLDMMTAMKVNELGRLGDRSIGTRFPLKLHLVMDQEKCSPIGPDGLTQLTIGKAQIFCADREVKDPLEQKLAWMFMQYGDWEEQEAEPIVDGDRVLEIRHRWEPEANQNIGFELVGTLSRIFAKYFAQHTIDDKEVVQFHAPTRPDWFTPLIHVEHKSDALPLWRFTLEPNYS
jgi:hypothetical protein